LPEDYGKDLEPFAPQKPVEGPAPKPQPVQ
jgi:hypothetical protein